MAKSKFYNKISVAQIEREVEVVYNEGLALYFDNATITHPFACDGLIDTKEQGKLLKLIMEYKYDKDLKNTVARACVIVQVLYYIKKFEQNGLILPNVCLVGDIDECFVFHTNDIQKYLSYDLDWNIAPSNAHVYNSDLVLEIANDEVINPFIFNIDENFSFKDVANKIKDLAVNVQRLVNVTEHNIAVIYEYFCNNVIKDVKSVSPNDLVAIFINAITDHDACYIHPKKANVLCCNGREIAVNGNAYDSFFSYFNKNYTPQEKSNFSKISDRLIEDTNRRNKGEFYTPTTFVDKAHRMIEQALGEDWKEKYVVWDNCFDSETEYLSESGWRKMSEYDGGKVMQYNHDGSAEFVQPLRYINQNYGGEMLHYVSANMDVLCTPDHNFVVRNDKKGRNQSLFKIPAIELFKKYHTVKNVHLTTPKTFDFNGTLEIDEHLLRVYVAVNADGCYCKKGDWFVVSVKKERKVARMANLLDNAKIHYKKANYGEYTEYRFHLPINPKTFPSEWYNLSNKSKQVIMEEVLLWDGSVVVGKYGVRREYSTSKKSDADFISFVAASCGYGVNYREDNRQPKTNYRLAFIKIANAKISTKSTFTIEDNTDGMVYCFEVSSGMLVVRRNGKIYISSNCCGTKNLTRDYRFNELYCSTLEQGELDQCTDYNKEAVSFQFDFLNDSLDKLPKGLLDALKANKPIVFFLNPPYAQSASGKGKTSKTKISSNPINDDMVLNKIGNGSRNLYTQFLWRIKMIKEQFNLTNCHIALFSPAVFLSGTSFAEFRNCFLNEFAFDSGIQFKASHFADVADTWGISFSLWHNGATDNRTDFEYTLVDSVDGEIVETGKKTVYNTDCLRPLNKWLKVTNHSKKVETVYLSNPIKVRDDDTLTAYLCENAIGGYVNSGNNVYRNTQSCYLLTGSISTSTGAITHITEENFDKVVTGFAARKLVKSDWTNADDEYLVPDTSSEKWDEFVNDSIIFSIFNSHSQQSSLRQVEYKGKKWNIKNEFFWRSAAEMAEKANACGNDKMYNDARVSNDRYVYNKLQGIELSAEAKAVLDKANEILDATLERRQVFDAERPEYQVNNWDAGFYQIKAMATKEELKEFKALFDRLADKMRPMVYELGFLK